MFLYSGRSFPQTGWQIERLDDGAADTTGRSEGGDPDPSGTINTLNSQYFFELDT